MIGLVKQDYNENRKKYEKIRKELRKEIDKSIPIEQVGSTAIPSIHYGKNIIDILIGARNEEQFASIKKILEDLNFVASKKSKDDIYQFFSSTADETRSGDTHSHLAIMDTERYLEVLVLKNYLLANEKEAKEYSDLKVKLVHSGVTDRREYKKSKSEYVSDLLKRAKENKKKNIL